MRTPLILLAVLATAWCTTVVAYSSTSTLITSLLVGSGLQPAVLVTPVPPVWASMTALYTVGKWIWLTPTPTTTPESVTIKQDFKIACPNLPLTLSTNVDDAFTFSLLWSTGSGSNWGTNYKFNISTTGVECCENISMTMGATNKMGAGGVIYEITSPDCPNICSGIRCGCTLCSTFIPGCMVCVSPQVCISCKTSEHRKYDPVNNVCVCIDGFYENIYKVCVPCPLPCKTCKLVNKFPPWDPAPLPTDLPAKIAALLGERTPDALLPSDVSPDMMPFITKPYVVCLTCPCELHRVYNPKTQTCDCETGYHPSKCDEGLCLPNANA